MIGPEERSGPERPGGGGATTLERTYIRTYSTPYIIRRGRCSLAIFAGWRAAGELFCRPSGQKTAADEGQLSEGFSGRLVVFSSCPAGQPREPQLPQEGRQSAMTLHLRAAKAGEALYAAWDEVGFSSSATPPRAQGSQGLGASYSAPQHCRQRVCVRVRVWVAGLPGSVCRATTGRSSAQVRASQYWPRPLKTGRPSLAAGPCDGLDFGERPALLERRRDSLRARSNTAERHQQEQGCSTRPLPCACWLLATAAPPPMVPTREPVAFSSSAATGCRRHVLRTAPACPAWPARGEGRMGEARCKRPPAGGSKWRTAHAARVERSWCRVQKNIYYATLLTGEIQRTDRRTALVPALPRCPLPLPASGLLLLWADWPRQRRLEGGGGYLTSATGPGPRWKGRPGGGCDLRGGRRGPTPETSPPKKAEQGVLARFLDIEISDAARRLRLPGQSTHLPYAPVIGLAPPPQVAQPG